MSDEIFLIVFRALVGILAVVLTRYAIPAAEAYIGAQRLATLKNLAREAYAFVEAQAPHLLIVGQAKLDMALDYLDARLTERRINVTTDQMRGVIEEVWLEYHT
jgi:hypothetical protein